MRNNTLPFGGLAPAGSTWQASASFNCLEADLQPPNAPRAVLMTPDILLDMLELREEYVTWSTNANKLLEGFIDWYIFAIGCRKGAETS